MEIEQVIKLIKVVNELSMDDFQMQDKDFQLHITRNQSAQKSSQCSLETTTDYFDVDAKQMGTEAKTQSCSRQVIHSPMVGCFYTAPGRDEAPFVQIGDDFKEGQILGNIEAMKMMNELSSECKGKVVDILAQDGQLVEYGQPLFAIEV
ncbi:acetyl-CoA carboxylase biotin carboxyl carrier protein [Clostridium sp. C105KSO13]|uniref:acetyl-CoA carboxylase biotin carboxyl carrier protein n=1 Tax=Clostridium sp. C105KSO13 TaxID=1776045 RepID=UPI0007408162|nr:acetyl-CoA carboxylase biotin carboxyl carrier protein [Clostridium sp. C105KSO13]CUX19419.1 Biotin carboxyl carrier protein of acetyl-CoA carboxylase [Clostridium sp. C105KSO13]